MERLKARQKGKYSAMQLPHQWTEKELKQIEEESFWRARALTSAIGKTLRLRKIKAILKGPLGMTDEIATYWWRCTDRQTRCHGVQLRQYKTHRPGIPRPRHGALEPIFSVHYKKRCVCSRRTTFTIRHRISETYMANAFTENWIGDDGWLKRSHVEFGIRLFFGCVL